MMPGNGGRTAAPAITYGFRLSYGIAGPGRQDAPKTRSKIVSTCLVW